MIKLKPCKYAITNRLEPMLTWNIDKGKKAYIKMGDVVSWSDVVIGVCGNSSNNSNGFIGPFTETLSIVAFSQTPKAVALPKFTMLIVK